MSVRFPEPITEKCFALIKLGNLLQLFDISLYLRVLDVSDRLRSNQLYIHDVQDIQKLCSAVLECKQINDLLKEDITNLSDILDIFIAVAAAPTMVCGVWANAKM